jgi:hypothetical protein
MMPVNAFLNQPTPPNEAALAAALGPAKAAWDQLLSELAREQGVDVQEWKCYSPKWGWSLRVKRKARTIVWLAPSEGCFIVLFILGGRAMQVARQAKVSQRIVKAMAEAPKYPEGTGIRLTIRSPRDVSALRKLAAIKLAN